MNDINRPGIYFDFPEEHYHADPLPTPSLSSSIARVLTEETPLHAWTQHPKLNPGFERVEKAAMTFGSAAHKLVLGRGKQIRLIEGFDDWKKNDAKAARDQAFADGVLPILVKDSDRAFGAYEAFQTQARRVPLLAEMFLGEEDPDINSEVVLAWQDGGIHVGAPPQIWCRGMIDRLRIKPDRMGRAVATTIDYKTTEASALPTDVIKRAFDLGQDVQRMFYKRGLSIVRPDIVAHRHFIVTQEVKKAPYALSIVELDMAAEVKAEHQVAIAIEMWGECLAAKFWPGYADAGTAHPEMPGYVDKQWQDSAERLMARPRPPRREITTDVGGNVINPLMGG